MQKLSFPRGVSSKSSKMISSSASYFQRKVPCLTHIRVAVAVPFVWESQPGTPKYTIFSEDTTLPAPLTPPPSYYFNTTITACKKKPVKNKGSTSRSNLLMTLFPKLNLIKKTILSSPPFSSSPSFSWSSEGMKLGIRKRFLSYGSSSFDLRGVDDEEDGATSPTSTLCLFGIPRSTSSNRRR